MIPFESRRLPALPLGLGLAGGIVVLGVLAVGLGSAQLDAALVARIVVHGIAPSLVTADWSDAVARIVLDLRLPRIVLAVLVGAGLAMVGVTLQAVTRNPLADPYLFGVSAGASVGAVLVIAHIGDVLGPLTLPLAAFAGALLSLFLVIGIAASTGGLAHDRLILAGVAVSFVLLAVTNFLIFWGDQRAAQAVVFWMMGGLGLARWDLLLVPAAVVLACGFVLWLSASRLDALLLGDETASSLGIGVMRLRLLLFALSALVTGVLVAIAGSIGFVGLMVPHVVRLLVGGRHAVVLPIAALVGALLLVGVDILARVVLAPQELPIGIITGAVGGLFFLLLMGRQR